MSPVPAPPHAWSVQTAFDVADPDIMIVRGRLGTAGAVTLDAALTAATVAGRHLRLDLGSVDYISSAGLAVLRDANTRLLATEGRLELVKVSEPVRLALRLAGEALPISEL